MKLFLFILVVILLGAGVVVYYIKKGKISDRDGDLIPDVVEDTIEDVKATTKEIKRNFIFYWVNVYYKYIKIILNYIFAYTYLQMKYLHQYLLSQQ